MRRPGPHHRPRIAAVCGGQWQRLTTIVGCTAAEGPGTGDGLVEFVQGPERLIDEYYRRDTPEAVLDVLGSVRAGPDGRRPGSAQSQDRAAWRYLDGGNAPGEQHHEPVTMSAAQQSGVRRQV
jgi:hypothetical protein